MNVETDILGMPAILDSCEAVSCSGKPVRSQLQIRAFTLIEIMIAVTILGMILLGIYSSWTAILRSTKVGLDAAAEAQRTRMSLRAIDEALGSAQLFTGNLPYYWFMADTSGDFADMSFVARLPASFPGSGLFGEQVMRRVRFSVDADKKQLLLQQTPLLEAVEANTKPYTIVLAPNIRLFSLAFLDTNQLEWLDEWPFTNQLPKIVRVALSFGDANQGKPRPEDIATETVFLSASAIPRQLQMPTVRGRLGAIPNPLQAAPSPVQQRLSAQPK